MAKAQSFFQRPILLAELIFAAVLFVFSPCLKANLSNWDDQAHIYTHPLVDHLSWLNTVRIFRDKVNGVYIPLTTLTFSIEKHFFGYDPGVIHLDNMLLHAVVATGVMLLGVALGLSGRGAFLAALLFALHPMHVESVAWATERKDVLYSAFYLGALLCWWRWLNVRSGGYLATAFLLALLSLLSKPMAISLPLTMALLVWYKDGWRRVPWGPVSIFVALAVIIGAITYSSFIRNPIQHLSQSLLIWIWTATFPLWKFFWPVSLHPLYDLPEPVLFWHWPFLLSFILTIGLIWATFRYRGDRLLLLALGWYVVSTFFLYRFDTRDPHIVADRFMYLSSVGVCFWLGSQADRLLSGQRRKIMLAMIVVIASFLCMKTYAQCRIWSDGRTLWNYVILQNPNRALAYNNRAVISVAEGRFDLALRDLNQAIMLNPVSGGAYFNRAVVRSNMGDCFGASKDFQRANKLGAAISDEIAAACLSGQAEGAMAVPRIADH